MFRLHSLTIRNHRILGSIHLTFSQDNGEPQGVYTSVIIGANGIGKSYILRSIAEIFSCLEDLSLEKAPQVPQYNFSITYTVQRATMEFTNIRDISLVNNDRRLYTQFIFKRDGIEVDIRNMQLPTKVIASATTITDKFVAKSTEMYRYKGLRNENSPSTTGTRTMVRKTVSGLLDSLDVKYGFRNTELELRRIFENQTDVLNRTTKLWGTRSFERIKEKGGKELEIAASFFNRLAERGFDDGKRQLKYNLLEETNKVLEDKEALKILSSLDLLTYPSLTIYKGLDSYEFDQSSSGESSLLCQMVSIMSDIEPNSLILIDEPENSAHPNWQISYMSWIKTVFEKYLDCHFIISTHSHFILTDLEPLTSDIVALEKKGGIISDVSEGVNTFSWSVDDILYRVFGVRNTRNKAFEEDIMELYKMISNGSKDFNTITRLIDKLSKVVLAGNDPLIEILNQAKKYVEINKTI